MYIVNNRFKVVGNLGSFTNTTVTLFNQLSSYQASPNVCKKSAGLHAATARLAKLEPWHLPTDTIGHFQGVQRQLHLIPMKKKKRLGLVWKSSIGTIWYSRQVPKRDKRTTQCLLSDSQPSAVMVYSINGPHLTENIILKDQKPTDVPVRHVCLPAKVQVERLIGLVKHHHPTELT